MLWSKSSITAECCYGVVAGSSSSVGVQNENSIKKTIIMTAIEKPSNKLVASLFGCASHLLLS